MKVLKSPSPGGTRRAPARGGAVKTDAAGRKLMAALDEIVQAELRGGAGLTVREVENSGPREYGPAEVRATEPSR